jgi:hypothetical protein
VADWISVFPGEIEAEVGWPKAPQDTAGLVALLGLADLRELDVRAGVETRVRWWAPGRLQIRAPREARFWRGLEERLRDPARVSQRTRWLQGHRVHEAWQMGVLAGLDMTDGRGYREWTLVASHLPATDLVDEIRALAPHRLTARVFNMRPKSLDLPREPARVRRWFVHWEGKIGHDPAEVPGIRPSWHYRLTRTRLVFGHAVQVEENRSLGRPPSLRLDARCGVGSEGLNRGEVRALARELPGARSWWHPDPVPRDPVGTYRLWESRAQAYSMVLEAGRPVLEAGPGGPRWWQRWPGTDDDLWLISHPRWPEQAFLARYPAVGPYGGRIEVRWGWHGPRLLYPAGDLREDLKRLRASGQALEDWWGRLAETAPHIL